MRDLKHLIYFESLLQEANNALVKQACSEGKLALAYNCSYIPEPLLDIEGCFGVRLRAPGCTNPDLATYYMTNRSCPYSKSILERAFEGGYNFISALIGQECCTTMNRMEQYFDYCKLIPNEKFFTVCIDMPIKKGDWYAGYFRRQIEKKILTPMKETYGIDYSEEKLMDAIERHNEICRLITEIGSYRKLDNPTITGYEFHVIQLVTLVCPKYLIVDKLRETAEELMRDEEQAQPTVTTSTLELGIDIGRLERAFQIDAPFTVSSFLQRMGRTGRRDLPPEMWFVMREEEPEPRTMMPETIPWKLLQGIALVQLYREEKWVEPPELDRLPYSLLYHQTMSTLASTGELTPAELAQRVLTLSYFHRISANIRQST